MKNLGYIVSLVVALSLAGCSALPDFTGKQASASLLTDEKGQLRIKRVGVLPFINESGRHGIGEVVTNIFVTVVFRKGVFEVEEQGNIKRFLVRNKVKRIDKISSTQIKRLGENVKTDAVFIGTVEEFSGGGKRAGAMTPVVSIRVRLVEAKTGKILWIARHRRTGDDYITLFEFSRVISVNELAKRVVSEILETIY